MYTDKRREKGITLLELLVAMVILAILSSLAVGVYDGYVRAAKRSDAQLALLQILNQQMKYRSNTGSYSSTLASLGYGNTSPDGHYNMNVSLTTTGFILRAQPAAGSSQTRDDDCQVMALTHAGAESAANSAGNDSTAECWSNN